MADLEHDVPNAPDTIFEAGSVSKQFTAAAVLLLARDGKLSIDDPVRKYIPELPDYGVAADDPSHADAHQRTARLGRGGGHRRLAARRRACTRTRTCSTSCRGRRRSTSRPGTAWSYSNTGYNLAAIIVSRVSGKPFADFSRERIFKPLGMTRTSWRDDFTRIVKHRAIAYDQQADGYHEDMPFENVHGNGGLLTTVGDLLRWNENFVTPKVGDAAFLAEEQTPGRFNDGSAHDYAFGLYVRPYRGVPRSQSQRLDRRAIARS